jgi:distal tail fiber protein|nr:MAG TPA: tail protein [Caudoviricetes sp.]
MIQRNVQELNSFIRIDKLSDLTNKNFNLEVGNDIFVMENLTFYKIKAVGTEPIGEGEIALNSELKIKKIITVGDSSDLKTKLDALSSEIETKLSRKENIIDKKSGFNLEKTNDFLNDESKILTSKAGSILKTRIDDVNDRLNSINLTWDRIQNKPVISDAINSNLSNQIASSKAILDASNAIKEHVTGNFISNRITDTSITTENKIQFYNTKYLVKEFNSNNYSELRYDENNPLMNYIMVADNYIYSQDFDKIKTANLKINSFNVNGIEFNNILAFNNGEILYKSSPLFPNYRKLAIENSDVSFRALEINQSISLNDSTYIAFRPGSTDLRKNSISTESILSTNITNRENIQTKNLNCLQKIIAGEIECRGNVKAYYASDIRLKSNIKKIDGALDKIDKISGYTFDMDGKREAGIIAQEIKEVLPEVVGEFEKDGEMYLNVDYPKIIALLIEAIKELKNGR